MDNMITNAFRPLYGLPCWNVKLGAATYLTLEFGQPHLRNTEPRTPTRKVSPRVLKHLARRLVMVSGDWHLWLLCCDWKLTCKGENIGDSQTDRGILQAAEALDGQILVEVIADDQHRRCLFRFDLGGVLETAPYDSDSEQWL